MIYWLLTSRGKQAVNILSTVHLIHPNFEELTSPVTMYFPSEEKARPLTVFLKEKKAFLFLILIKIKPKGIIV